MRPAPLIGRLVLAAHGSRDPRHPATIEAIAEQARKRTDREVVVAYLDHLEPRLAGTARAGDVVVPMLLSVGFHSSVDIPAAAPESTVTEPLGPDPLLAGACADRLLETNWSADGEVLLVVAGSNHPRATAAINLAAEQLQRELDNRGCEAAVTAAAVSGDSANLAQLVTSRHAVVPYLLAPGRLADQVAGSAARVVANVIGAHPAVVDLVLNRAARAAVQPRESGK